ncbi:MAG TPA: hypothetical protein VGW38_22850 [Chloroflexota bacterium]|nr:hypothetical protein [Chloroflexota bacterium]
MPERHGRQLFGSLVVADLDRFRTNRTILSLADPSNAGSNGRDRNAKECSVLLSAADTAPGSRGAPHADRHVGTTRDRR